MIGHVKCDCADTTLAHVGSAQILLRGSAVDARSASCYSRRWRGYLSSSSNDDFEFRSLGLMRSAEKIALCSDPVWD